MIQKLLQVAIATMLLFPFSTIQAYASTETKELGTFDSWIARSFMDQDKKVCFMESSPTKQEGKFSKRGTVRLFVTHWSGDNSKNTVSVALGYPVQKGTRATITIDGNTFKMAPSAVDRSDSEREMAWTEDQATDDALAAAIAKGNNLTVQGVSQKGTRTNDTYSLKGAADAYQAINKECGY